MSPRPIVDHDLPRLLGEAAQGPYPTYVHEILASTIGQPQRGRLRFLDHSITRDIDVRGATFGRPLYWSRDVLLLLSLMTVVAIAGAMLATGTRTPPLPSPLRNDGLPPPFGPARNGAIVTVLPGGQYGSLVELDPATGATLSLALDGVNGPVFSNDGRRIYVGKGGPTSDDALWVVNADGSGAHQVLPWSYPVAWAPDGRIVAGLGGSLFVHDVDRGTEVRYELGLEDIWGMVWRPDHQQILFEGRENAIPGVYLVNADGTGRRALGLPDVQSVVVSPDGSTIAYQAADGRLRLLDIDTLRDHGLTSDDANGLDGLPLEFSPDGTRLLVQQGAVGPHHDQVVVARERGIGAGEYRHLIVPISGAGPVVILGAEVHHYIGQAGGSAMFSPDGTKVLAVYSQPPNVAAWLFDTATGVGDRLSRIPGNGVTWQRLAP